MNKLTPLVLKIYGDGIWTAEAGFPRVFLRGEWRSSERSGAVVEFHNLEDVHEEALDPLRKAIKQALLAMSYL